MHLIFENVIKNLTLLWTGEYKGMDEGNGSYQLNPTVWEALGAAAAASGSTIPSAFGARPPNAASDKKARTAETWSFWMLYLGPVLLHRKFERPVYYDHYVELVKLVHLCLQFEISQDDIASIREGFQKWVVEYEKLYYQYTPDRLSLCPLTIHGLLHIADGIDWAGPVWAYWAFPMERFWGLLQPAIKSRRFPYPSIDNHVVATAQLSIIKLQYNLGQVLSLQAPKPDVPLNSFAHPSYPTCILLPPHKISAPLPAGLAAKIVQSLSTRFEKPANIIRQHFDPETVDQWGKVERLQGGDKMLTSALMHSTEDRRDATYVRYSQLVDIHANRRNVKPEYEPRSFYGQLQHIFVVNVAAAAALGLESDETLFLAAIRNCKIDCANSLDMHYYRNAGRLEVVDMTCVQCLVGRVKTKVKGVDMWAIIDRSGTLARPYYNADE
ncbi:hypothetical protein C8J57DRAFT_1574508 [Mycena rebaudengoi]|nr:hypothetical protein C8J57DRAFT_1574508 [Mycena rebaudengoi]